MSDVFCANCREPWDTYHLRHDEVHETAAGIQMIDDKIDHEEYLKKMSPASRKIVPFRPKYTGEPWEGKLTPFWRAQFKAQKWEFGESIFTVLRCSCCEANKEGAEERKALMLAVEDAMAGDEDGIISTLEDMGDMSRWM